MTIRWQGERLRVAVDGEPADEYANADSAAWIETTIFRSLTAERHTFTLDSDAPFLLDSVTVADRTLINLTPLIAGALIAVGMVIGVVVVSVYQKRQTA